MFGLPSLFKRPGPHKEVRYVSATRAESKLAYRKRVGVQLQLAVACAQLSDPARKAAIEAALSMPLTDKQKRRG